MVELILIIATLAIVIMAWSKINKALNWTGARIGETGDMLSDLTVSGSKQTARSVAISHGSLKDTVNEQVQKDIERTKAMTKFKEKLSADELKEVTASEAFYDKYINR